MFKRVQMGDRETERERVLGGSCGVKWWQTGGQACQQLRTELSQEQCHWESSNRLTEGQIITLCPSRQGLHIPRSGVCSEDQTGSSARPTVVLIS